MLELTMILYILLILFSLMIFLGIFYIQTIKEKMLQTIFWEIPLPICLINKQDKIIWTNRFFHNTFVNELEENKTQEHFFAKTFEESFSPKKVLQHIQVIKNDTAWVVRHTKIGKNFCIVFQPLKKEIVNWWEYIPFPIGILNNELKIEEANFSMKNILNIQMINQPITNFAPQFDIKQAQQIKGQDLIWHHKNGMLPILTWVKPYGDKKLLILENRAEVIKLKNKAQEAEHLQIIGQLASSIIHDFNNLLMAINGFSEALEATVPNNEMVLEIKRNTEQAANLAKELLNFVKQKPTENQKCDLAQFLHSKKLMLQKLLGSQIKVEITANYEGCIELSSTQMEQIILNMAINSKDAITDNLDKTAISNHSFSIIQRKKMILQKTIINNMPVEPGNYFILQISDTGTGINQENLKKIFQPFFSTKEKGTGLGLISCMRIIKHIGGAIDFETSAITGTKFILYLPIISANNKIIDFNEKKIQKDNAINNTNSINIVLAEDEEVIRNLTQKTLLYENYNVQAFATGNEALEHIDSHDHINLLITDAVLPGIDGIVLASKAQKKHPDIKILIISGYSYIDLEPNIKNHINNLENITYLAKPFTLKILKETITTLLK